MKTRSINRALSAAIVACIGLFFAGCYSNSQTASYDEIYGSSKKPQQKAVEAPVSVVDNNVKKTYTSQDADPQSFDPNYNSGSNSNTTYSTTSVGSDGSGNTYVTNNYFNSDDYYDYAYAARIKRFNTAYSGWGYYDDYYTNLYWYTYNPAYWGSSIYLGYNWWSPGFSIGFSWGWGWGGCYPYYGYNYYNPYYPYYPSYYGYNSYAAGWNNGYAAGYYDGYYGKYYNSYDRNSRYYRPMRDMRSSDGSYRTYASSRYAANRPAAVSTRSSQTFGDYYESRGGTRGGDSRYSTGRDNNVRSNTAPANGRNANVDNAGRGTTYSNERNTTNPANGRNAAYSNDRTATGTTERGTVNNRTTTPANDRSVNTTAPSRYNKPEGYTNDRTTPAGRTTNPVNVDRNSNYPSRDVNNNTNTRTYSNPTNTTPSRTTEPIRNNNSTPSRTTTPAPSRSNDSYSTPSRSNSNSGSYSAPSRSSSSGSSSPAPSRSGSGSSSPRR